MASACNATPPTSTPRSHIRDTQRQIRRLPARHAICPPAPIWSSIHGTIIASGSRGLICRSNLEHPMPATIVIVTNPPNGRHRRSSAGMVRPERDSKNMPRRFMPHGRDKPDATALLGALASDDRAPAFARASALNELGSRLSSSNTNLARAGLANLDPMVRIGALDMLESIPDSALAPRFTASCRILFAGCGSAPQRCWRSSDAQLPVEDRDSFERAAAEFVAAQQLNADRPEARSALGRFFAQQRDAQTSPKPSTRRHCGLSRNIAPAAINLADLYRQLGRENEGEAVLQNAPESGAARCRSSSCARAHTRSAEAARRGARALHRRHGD